MFRDEGNKNADPWQKHFRLKSTKTRTERRPLQFQLGSYLIS